MLVGLCVLSVPVIRHRFYNLFYRIHIPLYVTFLGLMFWHAGNEMDSWAYLWATLAIWLFQVVARLFTKWQTFHVHRHWFSGFPATLKSLTGDMVQVTVLVPNDLKWKPGQHCWLRMPHLSLLQNHPFTIANLPNRTLTMESDLQEMEFYVRAYNGLTRDLLGSVVNDDDRCVSMHVDGPYGGLVTDLPSRYTSLLFVCGGGGISAALPHILQAAEANEQGLGMVDRVHLVWMVRDISHTEWISKTLDELCASMKPGFLQVDFYITGNPQHYSDAPDADKETWSTQDKTATPRVDEVNSDGGLEEKPEQQVGTPHYARPYLPQVIPPLLQQRRTFVFGKPCSMQSPMIHMLIIGTRLRATESTVGSWQCNCRGSEKGAKWGCGYYYSPYRMFWVVK